MGWLNITPPADDTLNSHTEETIPSVPGALKFALGAFPTIFSGSPKSSPEEGFQPEPQSSTTTTTTTNDPKIASFTQVNSINTAPGTLTDKPSKLIWGKLSGLNRPHTPLPPPPPGLANEGISDSDEIDQIINSPNFNNRDHVTISRKALIEFVQVKEEIEATNCILEQLLEKSSSRDKEQTTPTDYWKTKYDQLRLATGQQSNQSVIPSTTQTNLQAKLTREIDKNTTVLEEYTKLSRQVEGLQRELNMRDSQTQRDQAQISRLQADITQIRSERINPAEHYKQRHELDRLRLIQQQCQQQHQNQQNHKLYNSETIELSNLRGQIIQSHQQHQQLQAALSDAQSQLNADRQKYIQHVQTLEDQISHLQKSGMDRINTLEKDNRKLESELAAFRTEYTRLEIERLSLEKVLRAKVDDIERLFKLVKELEDDKRRGQALVASLIKSRPEPSPILQPPPPPPLQQQQGESIRLQTGNLERGAGAGGVAGGYETIYSQQVPNMGIGSTTPVMPPPKRLIDIHNNDNNNKSDNNQNYYYRTTGLNERPNVNAYVNGISPSLTHDVDVTMLNASLVGVPDRDVSQTQTQTQMQGVSTGVNGGNSRLKSIIDDPVRLAAARKRIQARMMAH